MSDKPKLLAGGNPQIPKGDGREVVQAYLDALPGWKQDVGRRIDAVVLGHVPDAAQAVRWNTPFYGVEGQGWFLGFHCLTKYIKVTFLNGESLTPMPPVDAAAKGARYWHVTDAEDTDWDQFADWVKQAATHPGEAIF